jgi:serine/threonine-protein kinase
MYAYARLSPDGTRIALDIREQDENIWIYDIARQTMARLTSGRAYNRGPIWSPDGTRIAFASARAGGQQVFWTNVDGSAGVERLTTGGTGDFPTAFDPSGSRVVFNLNATDIAIVDINNRMTRPLVQTPFVELNGVVSPDGRWVAYQSNESGRAEIYLRPYPDVQRRQIAVSTGGGTRPLFSHDGRELFFYIEPGTIMAVSLSPSGELQGAPRALFSGMYPTATSGRFFDVTPDSQRFLMVKSTDAPALPTDVSVVLNWVQDLKRRASQQH